MPHLGNQTECDRLPRTPLMMRRSLHAKLSYLGTKLIMNNFVFSEQNLAACNLSIINPY